MKKIYSKPEMVTQKFSAEEYCTTCANYDGFYGKRPPAGTKAVCSINKVFYDNTGGYPYIVAPLFSSQDWNGASIDSNHYACGREFEFTDKAFFGGWKNADSYSSDSYVWIEPIPEEKQFTIQLTSQSTSDHHYHAASVVRS